jgi:hypothetical protein
LYGVSKTGFTLFINRNDVTTGGWTSPLSFLFYAFVPGSASKGSLPTPTHTHISFWERELSHRYDPSEENLQGA